MVETNKLIAKFMGYESYLYREYTMFVFEENNHRTEIDLHYHSSWDWLMPVVEKIEREFKFYGGELQLKLTKYSSSWQRIDEEGIVVNDSILSKFGTYGGTEKIEAVYKSVVQFIEFHNKNNN